jgi:transforming growth factor-beta-induced protein
MKTIRFFSVLLISGFFLLVSCNKDVEMPVIKEMNLVETAQSAGQFNLLLKAADKAGLVNFLSTESNITVFAPTDDAFNQLLTKLGYSSIDQVDNQTLASILKYHVIGNVALSSSLKSGVVSSLNTNSPDKAPLSLIINVGSGVMVNNATVVRADITASNGVIHVIDKVLLPPTVVDLATFSTDFSSLVSAVVKANLVETLNNGGPFTVFAPTNAAFSSLFSSLGISGLEAVPLDILTGILTYHVVGDNVRSLELSNGSVRTVSGKPVEFSLGSSVTINGKVKVINTDIQGTNGVIHVIDNVLLP